MTRAQGSVEFDESTFDISPERFFSVSNIIAMVDLHKLLVFAQLNKKYLLTVNPLHHCHIEKMYSKLTFFNYKLTGF